MTRLFLLLSLLFSVPVGASPPLVRLPPGRVFACDGAGDFRATSQALRTVLHQDGQPVAVETVIWSHGYLLGPLDQCNYRRARQIGRALAGRILEYHRCHPTEKIYLLGHSAGAGVTLTAAEHLPPGIVERIVLFAPSLSAGYDLRLALRHSRLGIDSFFSHRDTVMLGMVTGVLGTADRCWGPASGRHGFAPPLEPELAAKLHQHPWREEDSWTGNHGGHSDWYSAPYLRCHVLPLLGGQ